MLWLIVLFILITCLLKNVWTLKLKRKYIFITYY